MTSLVISLLATASAADLLVPDDYPSVQDAVDAASNGDHVIVTEPMDGQITISNQNLTLRGIGMTEVVLTGASPVLLVSGSSQVTVQHLTLDAEGSGRGLRSNGSGVQLTLQHVKVANGNASADGGGLVVSQGTVDAFDSIFCGAGSSGGSNAGGAVYVAANHTFTATRTVFQDNARAGGDGGATYNNDGTLTLDQCALWANDAANGSALYTKNGPATIRTSIVANHTGGFALSNQGGGSSIQGGGNLYDGNSGGYRQAGALPNDVAGPPDLFNPTVACNDATWVDFTSISGGNSASLDVGPAGADSDGDGYGDRVDCAPSDASRHPGALEVLGDGVDQNCDGLELCYADADGDGYPSDQLQDARYSSSLTCTGLGISDDNGGLFDCNDNDPYATEIGEEIIGDGIDSDCDGAEICYVDQDGDGYRTDDTVVSADSDCDDPEEALAALPSGDCDDREPNANPAETELVGDGIDNDCDGLNLCYVDLDDDGYHTGATAPTADNDCDDPGEATDTDLNGDCDDANPDANPGETEIVADGVDQDCDGEELCYADQDGDGYRTDETIVSIDSDCNDPPEALATLPSDDCDDANPDRFPGNPEVPADGIDQDCDNQEQCYRDNDGDDFGSTQLVASTDADCADNGESSRNDDCNDTDDTVYPGAPEGISDGIDQDCDNEELCYVDDDRDGDGTELATTTLSSTLSCIADGVSPNTDDCNDNDATIFIGATEVVNDGVDQNCDNQERCPADADGDGFGALAETSLSNTLDCTGRDVAPNTTDCDDTDDAVNPDGTEEPADDVDQDCDGFELCYDDVDQDGYGTPAQVTSDDLTCTALGVSERDDDCDDGDNTRYPGAEEIPSDGIDQDCDGTDLVGCYEDLDGDGIGTTVVVGDPTGLCTATGFSLVNTDCDDGMADVYPGAPDDCDGIDNDCSEVGGPCEGDDDWDGDGLCAQVFNLVDNYESESWYGTDDCLLDSDGDSWQDVEELDDLWALDPASNDTDGDGVTDGVEWPRVTTVADSPKPDLDEDGVPDIVDEDDDGDGVDSVDEGGLGVDSDGDGIPDREDIDDDGDGIASIDEPGDFDGDGTLDRLDQDDDGDGWLTLDENQVGANPRGLDSDGDARLDQDEGRWDYQNVLGYDVNCVDLAQQVDPSFAPVDAYPTRDFDGDGRHDLIDTDDDGDGILTLNEGNDDLDRDGCPNSLDLDLDGDGKLDSEESIFDDADKDSIPDPFDANDADGGLADSDGDGVLTLDETPLKNGTLPLDPDTSCAESFRDAVSGAEDAEVEAACDLATTGGATSTGDLAIDGLELGGATGYDPVDRDGDGVADWRDTDDDGDGIPTVDEVGFSCDEPGWVGSLVYVPFDGTLVFRCEDPTGEQAPSPKTLVLTGNADENSEVAYRDTDGDGLYDFQDPDDDNDGRPTAEELASAGAEGDIDGDTVPDYLDANDQDGPLGDRDADGIPNDVEETLGLDPFNDDTDGDGVLDDEEIGEDPYNPLDSDGDGTPDVLDEDDDNDGVPTSEESRADTDDDGIPDYLDTDSDGDGVDDGVEYGLDDDCDSDPDHLDPNPEPNLCDQADYVARRYERQPCSCSGVYGAGGLTGWMLLGLSWTLRRRP